MVPRCCYQQRGTLICRVAVLTVLTLFVFLKLLYPFRVLAINVVSPTTEEAQRVDKVCQEFERPGVLECVRQSSGEWSYSAGAYGAAIRLRLYLNRFAERGWALYADCPGSGLEESCRVLINKQSPTTIINVVYKIVEDDDFSKEAERARFIGRLPVAPRGRFGPRIYDIWDSKLNQRHPLHLKGYLQQLIDGTTAYSLLQNVLLASTSWTELPFEPWLLSATKSLNQWARCAASRSSLRRGIHDTNLKKQIVDHVKKFERLAQLRLARVIHILAAVNRFVVVLWDLGAMHCDLHLNNVMFVLQEVEGKTYPLTLARTGQFIPSSEPDPGSSSQRPGRLTGASLGHWSHSKFGSHSSSHSGSSLGKEPTKNSERSGGLPRTSLNQHPLAPGDGDVMSVPGYFLDGQAMTLIDPAFVLDLVEKQSNVNFPCFVHRDRSEDIVEITRQVPGLLASKPSNSLAVSLLAKFSGTQKDDYIASYSKRLATALGSPSKEQKTLKLYPLTLTALLLSRSTVLREEMLRPLFRRHYGEELNKRLFSLPALVQQIGEIVAETPPDHLSPPEAELFSEIVPSLIASFRAVLNLELAQSRIGKMYREIPEREICQSARMRWKSESRHGTKDKEYYARNDVLGYNCTIATQRGAVALLQQKLSVLWKQCLRRSTKSRSTKTPSVFRLPTPSANR